MNEKNMRHNENTARAANTDALRSDAVATAAVHLRMVCRMCGVSWSVVGDARGVGTRHGCPGRLPAAKVMFKIRCEMETKANHSARSALLYVTVAVNAAVAAIDKANPLDVGVA